MTHLPPAHRQLAVIVAGLAAASVASAAADSEESRTIEEIVVTAAKREQGLYDVSASLSVFDGGTLAERGVGVYADGVHLGRQVGQHWNLTNIEGVERVEVLRGPHGTLYGRNSIGGAINIVTAPGSNPGKRLSARVGSRGRTDASLLVDGNLSDTQAATVSTGLTRRGGPGLFRNLPDVPTEEGATRELSARAALGWRPSPSFSLTLAVDANDGTNGLNPYTTLIDEIPGGAVFAAGYRNADLAIDPYDNKHRPSRAGPDLQCRTRCLVYGGMGLERASDGVRTTRDEKRAPMSARDSSAPRAPGRRQAGTSPSTTASATTCPPMPPARAATSPAKSPPAPTACSATPAVSSRATTSPR